MYRLIWVVAAALLLVPSTLPAQEAKVPDGTENLVIDSMSKAREAAGKKVVKGPVPLAHQDHVSKGVACADCHHKLEPGNEPEPCSSCHSEKTEGSVPKLKDAFHGGDGLPALQSCIGCHQRKLPQKPGMAAPVRRDPCDACHSLLKKS